MTYSGLFMTKHLTSGSFRKTASRSRSLSSRNGDYKCQDFGFQAAIDGLGIAFATELMIVPHVAAGRLVPLLERRHRGILELSGMSWSSSPVAGFRGSAVKQTLRSRRGCTQVFGLNQDEARRRASAKMNGSTGQRWRSC